MGELHVSCVCPVYFEWPATRAFPQNSCISTSGSHTQLCASLQLSASLATTMSCDHAGMQADAPPRAAQEAGQAQDAPADLFSSAVIDEGEFLALLSEMMEV